MDIESLFSDLTVAYSNDNLNLITAKLIELYKNRNHGKIREIANKISKYILIEEERDAKCFSKLIMLYHPDKGEFFRKTIQDLYERNDYESLEKFSHIFLIPDIDYITVTTIDEDVDYNPAYVWDVDTGDGYRFADSFEKNESEVGTENVDFEKSFFNMIKMREYGNTDVEIPTYYMEDFEEFEMAYSGIESLSGVEYCIHVKILDLSNNMISDLKNLWKLENLEELYLANNQIGYIDTLSNLINLKVLDLSGNQIDDITPLLELEKLEYVNLIGNFVPDDQIDLLVNKGMIIMTERV